MSDLSVYFSRPIPSHWDDSHSLQSLFYVFDESLKIILNIGYKI